MRNAVILLLIILSACAKPQPGPAPDPEPVPPAKVVTYGNESLVAVDPAGNTIGYGYPAPREKKVGIFYFVWIGAHGYDKSEYHDGDILPPTAADTDSPFDISEMEKGYTDPQNIPFAPHGVMHHWGKPYLDYYVSNDKWVIRRHAQMLSEAGIDVIFIDLTNGPVYLPVLKALCEVYWQMIREGNSVPKISFVLNNNPANVIGELLSLYDHSDYERLWYMMNGRPLILAPLNDYGAVINGRFTFRYAWFDTTSPWWGDGSGRWAWGEYSPQRAVSEEMPIMAGSHAHLNIGRSYTGNSPAGRGGHQPTNPDSSTGTYFKQQFERAIACDPDLIFITGWNEWTAQRQVNGLSTYYGSFLGKPIGNGDTYFVDCYNHEYSRDIEPCANDFLDTYYYYMVDYVRRYKGVKPVAPVSDIHRISIDGRFADWAAVGTRYRDYKGDTGERDHWGYGYSNISLKNSTGRNDICFAKAATDAGSLFFYVETTDAITPHTDRNWMRLFISVKGSDDPSWEGFQWVVNNKVPSKSQTMLQRSKGGWSWEDVETVAYAVEGNKLELSIPLRSLGITSSRSFTVDFKWIDNSVGDGDICECMTDGDSAPGDRFRYRYIFEY